MLWGPALEVSSVVPLGLPLPSRQVGVLLGGPLGSAQENSSLSCSLSVKSALLAGLVIDTVGGP